MAKIINVKGRQVFDSRGNPTVEAEVFLENNNSTNREKNRRIELKLTQP